MNGKLFSRYPALVPLLIMSGTSVLLYLCRVIATGSARFFFLNWNLFLAWLPLLFVWLLSRELKRRRWIMWQSLGLSALWLAFLPNSFYMVTDFIHLRSYSGVSLVFDIVMFMSFALASILVGLVSVFLMHRELSKRLPVKQAWIVLALTFFLSSYAIYLGRYLGWNSWDLITDPFGILYDVIERFVNPGKYPAAFTTTALFFVFISSSYTSFYVTLRTLKLTK